MKSLFLMLMLFSTCSQAADVIIPKSQFVESMKTALPNAFCSEKMYFRKCFKISEDVCLSEAIRATKVCVMSMNSDMPEKFHQPVDGTTWGSKVGECAGKNFEISLIKSKVDSADCKDIAKWK